MSATAIPKLLIPETLAMMLSLPTRRVVKLARAGRIPHILIDGGIFFDEADVAEWVNRSRIPPRQEVVHAG